MTDGNYIITGWTSMGDNVSDILLIKTDSSGNTLWRKLFGRNSNNEGISLQQTTDGGYIVLGFTYGLSNIFHIWLIKTNSNGDTLWTRIYENGIPCSVQQTADGGYVMVGEKTDYGYIWLLKTDSNGDTLWTKTFGESFTNIGNSVRQTNDGGYIIVGSTYDFYMPFLYFQIIRTDSAGNSLWTKTFEDGYGNCVQQTTDGGYIFTGYLVPEFTADLWLIKTAPDPVPITELKTKILSSYLLYQNYPNPFNPSTTIEFDLPKTSEVSLKVFNILGEEVASLVSGKLVADIYSCKWDASNLASGVYLYRIEAEGYIETRKMVLLR